MTKITNCLYRASYTYLIVAFFLFGVALVFPKLTHAAALYLSPGSNTYTVGSTFSVDVFVSSTDQAMNAVSGVVTFPPDKLSVASVSKIGTIVNFWAQEPYFTSNTVNFEGVVFNPGYTGSAGKIVRITFLAKSAGTATVSFSAGSVLANDGNGTNITSSLLNATYNLEDVAFLPNAPQISSSTHPDPNQWYVNTSPVFTWNLPGDVDMVRLSFDQNEGSVPTSLFNPAIAEQTYENISDGISYFKLQFHNSDGWGPTSTYKVQIDTTAPEAFTITEVGRSDPTDPFVTFKFDVTEAPSGVSYFEIRIDDGEWERWEPNETAEYTTIALDSGEHRIFVKAYDQAGNFLEESAQFLVAAIDPPRFIDYDESQFLDKYFVLKGTTYADSLVTVWLKQDNGNEEEYEIESDEDGKFTFVSDSRLAEGTYEVWAKVIDTRGAESPLTERITITVGQAPLVAIPFERTALLYVVIALALILLVIIFVVLWHYWKEHMHEHDKKKTRSKRTSTKKKSTSK